VNSGQLTKALEFLQTLKARASERSLFAPVVAREVDVRFMLGDTLGAVQAALDLATSSATPETADAVNGVASRVPISKLSDEVLLGFTGVLLKRNRLVEAQRLMTVAQGRPIEGPGRERRRLLNSELLYKERKYSAAQREAEGLFGDPSLERDATILRARIYRGMEQRIRSARSYEAFATAYPFDSKAPEALYVAGDLYHEEGKYAKWRSLFTRIVETYPGHKYSRLATLRMALDHMARKEYTRGARMLEQTLERGGRDDAALLYYLAEMYGRMRKKEKQAKLIEEIVALNPVSFYLDPGVPASFVQPMTSNDGTAAADSQSVLEFLERVYEEREGACERIRDVLGAWENRSAPGEWGTYLIRGRAFLEMGFRDWAERELRILESKGPLPPRGYLELGALYDDFAMPWRSVRLFQRVYYSVEGEQRRKLDRDFELLMCPTPFPSLVFENCSRHGISPHLVYAMMRAESRFDEKAVSSAGAMGLMQIMPETGGQVAEELGFPAGARMDLLSPEINLAFGIKYASRLIERSNKDPLMMLAAYNAGFTNAKKWFGDASSKSSPAERVDGIDFGETREYIKRIVESARLYHAFYFSPEAVTGQPHPRPGTVPPSEGEQ
jgi:soluble lytic murein transglycosylase